MSTTAEKLTYLNTTKQKIKEAINNIGGSITSETPFRQYVAALESIYQSMPKVSGSGTSLSLSPTLKGLMQSTLKGNTSQKTAILPSEYTQVDYIIPTGTTYINTGIKAKGSLKIITDIEFVDTPSGNMTLFGARDTSNVNSNVLLYAHSTPRFRNDYNTTIDYASPNISNLLTKWHIVKDKGSFTATSSDNQTITETTTNATFTSSYDMYIFNANSGGSTMNQAKYRLYNFTIYDDTTLVRDFIPCYRSSDSAVGLYDIVNGVFYEKSGSGSLSYGSVVNIPNPSYPQDIHNVSGDNDIVVCGKNLFDKDNANYLNAFINGSGVIKTDTNASVLYIPCLPNTSYAIQKSLQTTTASNRFKVGCCTSIPTTETQLSKYNNLPNGTTATTMIFETDSTAKYLVFNFAGGNQSEYPSVINAIQIEYGSATTFEAYNGTTYPINLLNGMELCKIGDYQDYFYKDSDKWYLHKEVRHLSLAISDMNNTENYPGWTGLSQLKQDYPNVNDSAFNIGMKYYNNICKQVSEANDYIGINTSSTNETLTLRRAKFGNDYTQTYWKTNYPNLIIELYYGLPIEKQTDTEQTDTTLIEQLNDLESANSRNGTTNINQENNDLPFIIDVSCLKGE